MSIINFEGTRLSNNQVLNVFLQAQDCHHDGELHHSREAGAEREYPPEEVAVPDVEDEVGHGHRGSGVKTY